MRMANALPVLASADSRISEEQQRMNQRQEKKGRIQTGIILYYCNSDLKCSMSALNEKSKGKDIVWDSVP